MSNALQPSGGGALSKQAATPVGGYALINGTGTIISWLVPSDGLLHRFLVSATQHVTVAETGGGININFVAPDGTSGTLFPFGAGFGAGVAAPSGGQSGPVEVQAGSTVSVVQAGALTAGAATVWAEILGS